MSENIVKIKHLGIDFGSSSTAVVGFTDEFDTPILFDFKGDYCFRTAIAKLRENRTYLYSLDAINLRAEQRGAYLFHNDLKERIKDKHELAEQFLTELLTRIRDTECRGVRYDFSDLESVCYGHPEYLYRRGRADFIETMDRILPAVVKRVFGRKRVSIFGEGEPQLATVAYHISNSNKKGYPIERDEVILTLDLGGYTLDMALLKADDDGVLKQIKSDSCEVVPGGTGKHITEKICENIYTDYVFDDGVDRAKIALYTSGVADGVPLKYKSGGERISLRYTESAKGKIHDTITVTESAPNNQDKSYTVRVGEIYDTVARIVRDFLERCTDENDKKISHLLFTGGTSRIARMRDHVIEQIRPWLATNRNELHIDKYKESMVFIASSSVDRDSSYGWRADARIPLKAEYAVAYGAALVARDRGILKKGKMPRVEPTPEKGGLTREQEEHLRKRRIELKRIINELENGDIKSLDDIERKLKMLHEAMGKFPRD
ncbi:MAG: hypothetical protein IJF38_06865 [Clostridia bacterium]|nr:hypothetical protein [Clostridia bacterium]